MRLDGRMPGQIRPTEILRDYTEMALGSALISVGRTKVLCTVSMEERPPPWLRGTGKGWVTAEYSMLPGASPERIPREAVKGKQSGRTQEIQRLIGRSLRSCIDLGSLGEIQLNVDCDVLQADGGTRTASITGAFVALSDAVARLMDVKQIKANPIIHGCAAVSVGVVGEDAMVDLDYSEDSVAEVDMNIVMDEGGRFVEVQGTAEGASFSKGQLVDMIRLAESAIGELQTIQGKVLAVAPSRRKIKR